MAFVQLASVLAAVGFVMTGCSSEPASGAEGSETSEQPGTTASVTSSTDGPQTAGVGSGSDDVTTTAETEGATGDGETGDETGEDSGGEDESTTGDGAGGALHVSVLGQDSNPGTPRAPMRTLQWALAQAETNPEIHNVRVATGTYEADVANEGGLVMVDGVSMLGGWNEAFDSRDPEVWPTRLVDSSKEDPVGTTVENPSAMVRAPADVTTGTEFSGFVLQSGVGRYAASLRIEGSPTISRNLFETGVVESSTFSKWAIFIDGGTPVVTHNRLFSAHGTPVLVNASAPEISNNIVVQENNTATSVYLIDASPTIVGNSIIGGPLELVGESTPRIENNLVQSSWCIRSETFFPTSLRNNLLQCEFLYAFTNSLPFEFIETTGELHGYDEASGNVTLSESLPLDPDDDLRLDATAPCTVTRGGLDLSVDFPDDFDAEPRTAPVTIGAHEWDGDCQ